MKHATAAGVVFLFCLAGSPASAQPAPRASGFVSINAGIQAGSQRLAVAVPIEIFGTSGTLSTDDTVIGGALFDVSGGLRGRGFAFGAGFSRSSTKASINFTAATTSYGPGSFTRSVVGITPSLEHTERAVYVFAALNRRVTHKFDVMLYGGPTFFQVRQGIPTDVDVNEPFGQVQSVSTTTVDDSAIGLHVGLDFSYMFQRHVGIGALARYAWGSVDLANSTKSMTLGGLQAGAGVRAKF